MNPPKAKKTVQTTIGEDTGQRHKRKYSNRNVIQRAVLNRFFNGIAREIRTINPQSVLDFGCGEGFFFEELFRRGLRFESALGIDLREDALAEAQRRCPACEFRKIDLLSWNREPDSFDLVIASEVLEHLPEPGRFLQQLARLSRSHLLLTVPLEPWFRLMNLLRGRDLRRLGNHPEHMHLWGFNEFKSFVSAYVSITRALVVFPFTVVVARPLGV